MSAVEHISEAEILNLAISNRLMDLHVSMPARVESYSPGSNGVGPTVTVTPQLNRALPDGAGNYVMEQLPKLADIPVVFPRCKGFSLTFPLEAGDYVALVFAERNIGAWRATGNQGDPGDVSMHSLDGAYAIPGLYPDKYPAASASSTNLVIGKDNTTAAQIEITPTGIHLGAGATDPIAKANEVTAALNAIATLFANAVPGAFEPGLTAMKSAFAALTVAMTYPGSIGSSTAKVND